MNLLPPMFTVPFFLLGVLFVVAYLGTLGFLAVWSGSPYAKRTIKCPKSDQDCKIELDRKHALLSTLEGKRELCVKTCEHWPEQADCAQACVLGISDSCPDGFDCLPQSDTGGLCWPANAVDKGNCVGCASGGPAAVSVTVTVPAALTLKM